MNSRGSVFAFLPASVGAGGTVSGGAEWNGHGSEMSSVAKSSLNLAKQNMSCVVMTAWVVPVRRQYAATLM